MSDSLDDLFNLDTSTNSTALIPSSQNLSNDISDLEAVLDLSKKVLISYKQTTQEVAQGPGDGFEVIVQELAKLMSSTNQILNTCKYSIQTETIIDPELLSASSNLINSSKEIISEFLRLFKDKLKFYQTLELEKQKAQLKKDVNEHKIKLMHELKKELMDPVTNAHEVEYVQESIIDEILKNKNK